MKQDVRQAVHSLILLQGTEELILQPQQYVDQFTHVNLTMN